MKFQLIDGPRDVPAIGAVNVQAGDEVEATGEAAKSLERQTDVWKRVDKPKTRSNSDEES